MLQAARVSKRSYKGCFQVRDEVNYYRSCMIFLGWFQVSIKVSVLVASVIRGA